MLRICTVSLCAASIVLSCAGFSNAQLKETPPRMAGSLTGSRWTLRVAMDGGKEKQGLLGFGFELPGLKYRSAFLVYLQGRTGFSGSWSGQRNASGFLAGNMVTMSKKWRGKKFEFESCLVRDSNAKICGLGFGRWREKGKNWKLLAISNSSKLLDFSFARNPNAKPLPSLAKKLVGKKLYFVAKGKKHFLKINKFQGNVFSGKIGQEAITGRLLGSFLMFNWRSKSKFGFNNFAIFSQGDKGKIIGLGYRVDSPRDKTRQPLALRERVTDT